MRYAMVKMDDGSMVHIVLHVFEDAEARDQWVATEPEEPGHGEMWETGEREALSAHHAKMGIDYFDGVDLHDVRESDLPSWAYDAVNVSTMSEQQRDERHPGVVSYWTNVSSR